MPQSSSFEVAPVIEFTAEFTMPNGPSPPEAGCFGAGGAATEPASTTCAGLASIAPAGFAASELALCADWAPPVNAAVAEGFAVVVARAAVFAAGVLAAEASRGTGRGAAFAAA